nr:unnamed protein product [Callosobruchus analis]
MKIIHQSHIWLCFPINNIAEAQQEWSAKNQLQYMVRVKLDAVVSVVISSAVLHSISKYLNDPVPIDEQEDDINDEEEEEYKSENEDENVKRMGLQRREEIKNYFTNYNINSLYE